MDCMALASLTHTHTPTHPLAARRTRNGLHGACEFYTHPHADTPASCNRTHWCCGIAHGDLVAEFVGIRSPAELSRVRQRPHRIGPCSRWKRSFGSAWLSASIPTFSI